jgi:hypothetical protein
MLDEIGSDSEGAVVLGLRAPEDEDDRARGVELLEAQAGFLGRHVAEGGERGRGETGSLRRDLSPGPGALA